MQLKSDIYGDDAQPIFVAHEGDNEIAIFDHAIGYQLVIVSMGQAEHFALRDETWATPAECFASMSLFLISEYAGD